MGRRASLLLLALVAAPGCVPRSNLIDSARAERDRRTGHVAAAPSSADDGWSERWARANSEERQAHLRNEAGRFARAVASEPPSARLPLTAVAEGVLVDEARGLVDVSGPEEVVALEVATGAVRWRLKGGGVVTRAGRWLLVMRVDALRAHLSFVDPDAPKAARACLASLEVPPGATRLLLLPFERGDEVFLMWRSEFVLGPRGVPLPDEDQLVRAGLGCGVARVRPECTTTPLPLTDFLLSPPRDLGSLVKPTPGECRFFTPELELPSVAASRLPRFSAAPDGLRLEAVSTRDRPDGTCVERVRASLEASGPDGERRWRYPLGEARDFGACAPPPSAGPQRPPGG